MRTEIVGEEFEETLNRMKKIALLEKIAIGFGWVKGKKQSENHYTIVDKNGAVLEDYVKIHPFSYSGEDQFFCEGRETRQLCVGWHSFWLEYLL